MSTKPIEVIAHGNRYVITVRSSLDGYSARVQQRVGSGEAVVVVVVRGPRERLQPPEFYRDRESCGADLARRVTQALRAAIPHPLEPGKKPSHYDSYIRATAVGWPDGYPGAVPDDTLAWLHGIDISAD